MMLAGLLPWAACFVELYFILSSLFGSRAYYAFGFLFLTFCVAILTTATVTILFTYFMLCAEEYRSVVAQHIERVVHILLEMRRLTSVRSTKYITSPVSFPSPFLRLILSTPTARWHWRSFLAGGGSAVWLLVYGVFYWASRLSLDSFTSVVLYIGYLCVLYVYRFAHRHGLSTLSRCKACLVICRGGKIDKNEDKHKR